MRLIKIWVMNILFVFSITANTFTQNPIIKNIFTADPAVLIYKNTVFLYAGHDETALGVENYIMHDWHVFSLTDMVNWIESGECLTVKDFSWVLKHAYADNCVYRNGKFYWYVPVEHKKDSLSKGGFVIGVAVSTSPTGPFTDAIGKALNDWAYFRESQLKALSIPNTGMAVAIDVGEANDIHPLNKKDVGKRLFLAAEKVAYRDNKVVYYGPIYKSMKVEGNIIIIYFTNTGSGLIAKDGREFKYFAIAGADKKFVCANSKIDGNKVIVWNDKIFQPLAVRYAWANNPEGANLYNK